MDKTIYRRVAFVGAYFAVACGSLTLTRFDDSVAFIWGATALLIARLTTAPSRREQLWTIGLAYGANTAASALVGAGPVFALVLSVIDVGEGVLAAWMLKRWRTSEYSVFDDLGSLTRQFVAIGLAAPAISSALGAIALTLALGGPVLVNFATWLIAHSLGNLTFTPLCLLVWAHPPPRTPRAGQEGSVADQAICAGAVLAASLLAFGQARFPLLFLPVVAIMVATVRLGSLGAARSIALLAVIGCTLTVLGYGPVHHIGASPGTQTQYLQFYLAANTLAALPIAAILGQRKMLFDALHRSEESYRLVAENSTDIIMRTNLAGRILYVSPAVEKLSGYDPVKLVGRHATDVIHPDYVEHIRFEHRLALERTTTSCRFEYVGLTADGKERWFESTLQCLVDTAGNPTGAVSIIRDVSERKAFEDQLFEAALTDPLTGLSNRRAFMASLDKLAEREGPRHIAIFDLDHFKSINDQFGHDAGDHVLRVFADLARGEVRDNDLVARIGGEEFAMLFGGADATQTEGICQRVIDAFARERIYYNGQRIHVTASAGVAPIADSAERSLKRADAALYTAKAKGRDQLAYAA